MKTYITITATILVLSSEVTLAATLKIILSVSAGGELGNLSGVPLSGGNINVAGDGTLLQAGYYSLATQANPFLGQWISITGPGTVYSTTVGDGAKPDGQVRSVFTLDAGTLGFVEPAVGTPLVLRFYDAINIASATHFNAVTSTKGSFDWVAPTVPEAIISMDLPEPFVVWQGGSGSAYRTTIVIPEPTTVLILTFTMGVIATRRRRSKSID